MNPATELVLKTLDVGERYGSEIARLTGFRRPVVYGILYRLYQAGFLLDRWEPSPDGKGPPRRYWRLNPDAPPFSQLTEVDLLRAENARLRKQIRELVEK